MSQGMIGQFEPKGFGRGKFDDRSPKIELGALFDRMPPSSEDAERGLLGAILLDPDVLTDVVPIVASGEMFYSQSHGAIFQALLENWEARQSGDPVQLIEALRGKGILERVGGSEFIAELGEAVPSAAAAPHYARIVSDTARLRRLIDAAGTILHRAYQDGMSRPDSAKEVVDEAEKLIFDIAQEEEALDQESLAELLQKVYEQIEEAKDSGESVTGIGTGFDDLDDLLSGLQPGELQIMAARPSMGKTALALNLAEQVAFGGRTPWSGPSDGKLVPVGLFSLEMSRESLVQRLISARSGIDAHKLRTGQITERDFSTLQTACDELRIAPIHIDDTPSLSILQLRAKARRMVQRHGVKVLIIDYLQLLTSPGAARESRQVEVSEISRGIKALARELSVPIVCLAQLNRGAEQREGNRPKMSDLRESGSIEQDADVVMLLHREAYYHRGDNTWDPNSAEFDEMNREKLNLSEIIIAKQRNGPTGIVKLIWDMKTTRFKNFQDAHGGGHNFAAGAGYGHDPLGAPPAPQGGPVRGGLVGGNYPEPGSASYSFAPGKPTGPIGDHRDGGGPDRESLDPDLPEPDLGYGGGGDDSAPF
ncbi:MAG: replicative DNA helicase [Phycisphaerales bacterium]|jgi:replicative DNA helicase